MGLVVGTAAYMAPEQARGKTVDRRADIWAFGCVLFEMLTGVKPFDGETVTDVLSAIISRDPEWSKLPAATPITLRALMARCFEKNPRTRLRDIGEARLILEQPLDRPAAPVVASSHRLGLVPALVASVAALLIAGGAYWAGRRTAPTSAAPVLSYKRLTFDDTMVSRARFAPDGVTVVFSAGPGSEASRLSMLRLDSLGSTRLSLPPAELLALSPSAELALMTDVTGTRTGLVQTGTLARGPLFGGAPRSIQGQVAYADWHPTAGQLAIVRAGSHERLEYPVGHVLYETPGQIGLPRFSRDGRRIAFADWPVKSDDRGTVAVVEMDGTKRTLTRLWEGLRGIAWSPDDREVWFSSVDEGSLYGIHAVTLDGHDRLLLKNSTGLIIEDVLRDGRALVRQYDRSVQVGYATPRDTVERDLSWLGGAIARDISPDGRLIAFSYAGEGGGQNYLVFVRNVDGSDAVKIGEGQVQQFAPDGRSVLSIVHGPPARLLVVPIGTGETTTIPTGNLNVSDARWLADGKRIVGIATEEGHGRRAYLGDASGGFRPFSPENIEFAPNTLLVAGDGRVVLRDPDGIFKIFSPDGAVVPVPSLSAGEAPVAWMDGDRALLVAINGERSTFDRLDLAGGRREPWIVRRPVDPTFLGRRPQMAFSRDGRSYAANYQLVSSRLILIEGLR
jgi:dipeptidyl aminopeptidase/acylaminoacyl peptidase